MIAYEDLVAALNSWRGRNGLSTTPPDYGTPEPVAYNDAQSAPDEVYDLSDDSGLIMTEDVAQAGEVGAMEAGDDYAAYGDDAYEGEAASTEAYDEAPADADTMDVDEAGVVEEFDNVGNTLEADGAEVLDEQPAYDDPMPVQEDAMDAYAEPAPLDEPPEYDDIDAAGIIGEEPLPPADEDGDFEGETVVAADAEPGDEPEALPDMPDPDDEPRSE